MKKIITLMVFGASFINLALAQQSEKRSLDNFNSVEVGQAIKLTLVAGNLNDAFIKTDNIDLEDIITSVSGSKLKIGIRGDRHQNIDVEVTLTYKSIDALSVSSAASANSKGAINASSLDVSVSSAGSANLEIQCSELAVEVSSAADLTLSGKATSQRVNVSSAGEYRAYDLESETSYVRASSAGSATVNATKQIEARANSAGSIKYKGNPEKVYVDSNSGGSTSKGH